MKKNLFSTIALSFAFLFTMSLNAQDLSLGGTIRTEDGQGIHQVTVTLLNELNVVIGSIVTNDTYAFNNLTAGTYSVQLSKDIYPLNGVSTFDAVLATKHILGLTPLGSPYKLLAADVNNDQKLTTMDLVMARGLILAITPQFPSGKSWSFLRSNTTFPIPSNPWFGLPGTDLTVTLTDSDVSNFDFIGYKIFDLNGSAVPEN